MRREFLAQLFVLVRLRYQLIWAHSRTTSGKIALLLVLYLLGALAALFVWLGGFGSAAVAVQMAREEAVARWLLGGLFLNGIAISLVLGIGPRAVFSDETLRRYALTASERFLARHLVGLLDPVWIFLGFAAMGLVMGFGLVGAGSFITGLPTAVLFITANYLAAVVLLLLIGVLMESRVGAAVLGVLALGVLSIGPVALSLLVQRNSRQWWLFLDEFSRLTPPGAAAAIMIGESLGAVIVGGFALLCWCAGLALILSKLERRQRPFESPVSVKVVWDSYYDYVAGYFGRYAPLVGKALRYHLRSNLVRFNLITAPWLLLLSKLLTGPRGRVQNSFLIALAVVFVLGYTATATMLLNQFGYDGAGVRRYALLPERFADALRASSFASLLLSAVVLLAGITLWVLFAGAPLQAPGAWRMLVMLFSVALAGLFFFAGLGLWTSVLSPKRAEFETIMGNRFSLGAHIVMIGGVLLPLLGALALADYVANEAVLRYWWAALLLTSGGILVYAASFNLIERALQPRRERLINLIAGAQG